MRPIFTKFDEFSPHIYDNGNQEYIFKLNNKCKKNPFFKFSLATFRHAYSNGINIFVKYENVDEY